MTRFAVTIELAVLIPYDRYELALEEIQGEIAAACKGLGHVVTVRRGISPEMSDALDGMSTCQRCGEQAPEGNDLCQPCEQAEGREALTVLRAAADAQQPELPSTA